MKVQLAAKAGFCFGVKRALDMAEQTVDTMPAVSLGPLIHNQQVVECLAKRGIHVVNTLEEVLAGQALIIRSHGVGPSVYQEAEKKGIQVADATCPFVQKAQRLAAGSAQLGQQVIVFGDKLHQEVQGILGWAGKKAIPIQTLAEAKQLPFYPQLTVLAQTTQLTESFEEIVQELKLHTKELIVHNTICNATSERQKAARELAQTVDIMVVVGGRNSANTQKLANICAEFTKTYMIETAEQLEIVWFKGVASAGLTAGASTPDWIIKEVYQKMSEMNVNEMDKTDWLESVKDIHVGSRVTGKVVKITDDEVFVDIGWKSEGIVPFVDDKGFRQIRSQDQFSVGDEITAVVIRIENEEGYTVLSKRQADEAAAQERLAILAESKEEFPVKVVEVVKGGLLVDIGLRGFIPASQIQLGYVEDLNKFLGETLRVKIIEFDPGKRKVVLSQRTILEEEKAAKRQQLMETLQVGDIVNGVVLRIVNFGAFIDIGGIDGLLHISEMSYARIKHPSEVLKIGDEVQVQVLKFDKTTGRLSLGLKQLQENPWDRVAEKYPIGSIVQGVVVRIVPFGAFVELEEGVDGLVHISQLADYHVNKVEDILTVGDVIRAKVIECKPEAKRISLSLREADRDIGQTSDVEPADSQSESQVDSQSESQVDSQSESQVDSQSESQVELQSESQVESQSESQAENESVTIGDVLDQDHAQE